MHPRIQDNSQTIQSRDKKFNNEIDQSTKDISNQ